MQLIFANNAKTTLAGPISSTATSCVLATGMGALFPEPAANQYFIITFVPQSSQIAGEIAWVTARSGDTLTLVRGQEGTTASAYAAGDTVTNNPTAGSLRAPLQLPVYNGNPNGFLAGQAGSATESPDAVYQPPGGGGGSSGVFWICTIGSTNPSSAVWSALGEIVTNLIQGECRGQYSSATQISLVPYGGNGIVSGGVQYYLPSGGVSAANTGVTVNGAASQNLAASSGYLVSYNGAAGILKYWALGGIYGHAPDTTAGNIGTEVITISGTVQTQETLVMAAGTNSGAQFFQGGVASWFNPRSMSFLGQFSTTRSVTGATYQLINAELDVTFITFANRDVNFGVNGEVLSSVGTGVIDGIHTALVIDGSIQLEQCPSLVIGNTNGNSLTITARKSLSEGLHTATLYGGSTQGATGFWYSGLGSPTVANGTVLEVSIFG